MLFTEISFTEIGLLVRNSYCIPSILSLHYCTMICIGIYFPVFFSAYARTPFVFTTAACQLLLLCRKQNFHLRGCQLIDTPHHPSAPRGTHSLRVSLSLQLHLIKHTIYCLNFREHFLGFVAALLCSFHRFHRIVVTGKLCENRTGQSLL